MPLVFGLIIRRHRGPLDGVPFIVVLNLSSPGVSTAQHVLKKCCQISMKFSILKYNKLITYISCQQFAMRNYNFIRIEHDRVTGSSSVWNINLVAQTESSLSLSNTVLTLLYKTSDFQRNPEEFNWNSSNGTNWITKVFEPRTTWVELLGWNAHYWLIKS